MILGLRRKKFRFTPAAPGMRRFLHPLLIRRRPPGNAGGLSDRGGREFSGMFTFLIMQNACHKTVYLSLRVKISVFQGQTKKERPPGRRRSLGKEWSKIWKMYNSVFVCSTSI